MSSEGNAVTIIRRELEEIAVIATTVECSSLHGDVEASLVTIVSDDFEGQTYLDREQRIRPAVLRALLAAGLNRPTFVLDLQTPAEWAEAKGVPVAESTEAIGESPEERVGKSRWKAEIDRVKKALVESDYVLSEILRSRVFIASRERLAVERILVAFAESPRVQSVHTEALKAMRTARTSQPISAAYYLSPQELTGAFANQKPAPWLKLLTGEQFVHHLAGSASIAKALVDECREVDARQVIAGPCVEPEAINADRQLIPHVFRYVEDWAKRDRASVLVLVADAGHGKTTLTNELARRQAEAFLAQEATQLPLSVPFESVRRMVDFTALLYKRLSEMKGHAYGAFVELLRMGKATLYIDGFDELADDAGLQTAEAQVRSIRGLLSDKAKVVLAGRTVFATAFSGQDSIKRKFQMLLGPDVDVEVLELQPFDREKISEYLNSRRTLDEEIRVAVEDFVEQSPDHEELCGKPLFLRMLCSLSKPSEIKAADGLASLIEGVCRREETRQHLSISVQAQKMFLGMVANDMFAHGKTSLPMGDVLVHAELLAEELKHSAPSELASKLRSHALLTTASSGFCSFIHPYVRDVVLALSVLARHQSGDVGGVAEVMSRADLPLATVRQLASAFEQIESALPERWLSSVGRQTSVERRNWFRIVNRDAQATGKADWLRSRWTQNGILRGLDMSRLTVSALLFADARFEECHLDGVLFDGCRFENVLFRDSHLSEVMFEECEFVGRVSSEGGSSRSIVVHSGESVVEGLRLDELIAPIVQVTPKEERVAAEVDRAVRRVVENVLARLLEEFVAADGRTFKKGEHDLELKFQSHEEDLVYEKVVLPFARSKLFAQEMGAGSQVRYLVAKDWRQDARQFVENRRRTPRLREMMAKLERRARRHVGPPG